MLFRSDRKSTRLNSSHTIISYAVFCLKKKPCPGSHRPPPPPHPHILLPRHPPARPRKTRPGEKPAGRRENPRAPCVIRLFLNGGAPPGCFPFSPPGRFPG